MDFNDNRGTTGFKSTTNSGSKNEGSSLFGQNREQQGGASSRQPQKPSQPQPQHNQSQQPTQQQSQNLGFNGADYNSNPYNNLMYGNLNLSNWLSSVKSNNNGLY